MTLTLKEIQNSYQAIKKLAFEEYDKGNLQQALIWVDQAATFVQQFNWIYTDAELEDLLSKISKQKLKVASSYSPNPKRVVLFDDWCTSYVLALQYVEALSIHYEELMYITGRDISAMGYSNILDKVAQYSNVKIKVIPQNNDRFERTQTILDTIVDFCPSKLFLHIGNNSPITLALYSMPQAIDRYIINLSDQTFWLGAKGIDYTLDFRSFGATVSLEKRGLKKEQILYLPFYPVRDGNVFQGFPELAKDKVIIFSGGDFYKTLDPEQSYWGLVRDLLKENTEAIFLYATKNVMGKTKEFIDEFIKSNNFEERFIYIGFRPDIDAVFQHCDIFMGTCPVCGSLTSQLAAINSKPILQYYLPNTYDDETEQAICHNLDLKISFNDKRAFLDEGKRLIKDANYRMQKGVLMNKAMFTPEQFNKRLMEVVSNNYSLVIFKEIDYDIVAERWWWNELLGFYNTTQQLFGVLGKRRYLKIFPKIAFKYYFSRVKSMFKRMNEKGSNEN